MVKLTTVVLIIFFIGAFFITYTFFYEPYNVETTHNTFTLGNPNSTPLKVVFISDTQLAYYHKDYFANVITRINEFEPDLILIGGDVVNGEPRGWEYIGELGRLKSKYGTYSVLGNHDYKNWDCSDPESYAYADEVYNKLNSLGITVFRNEHKIFIIGNYTFALIGVDDYWACRSNYSEAVEGIPDEIENRIILVHQQESIPYEELTGTNLVLAGHTHCGQVRLPLIGSVPKTIFGFEGNVDMGRAKINDKTEIYVTCGVTPGGIRFLNRPEISVLYIE